MCCDVGLLSELRLTASCVLMELASPAVSETSVYANGLSTVSNFTIILLFLPASISLPSQHLDERSPEENHVLVDGYFRIPADPTL